MRRGAPLLALALVAASCSGGGGEIVATSTTLPDSGTAGAATTPVPARPGVPTFPPDEYADSRTTMVDSHIAGRGVADPDVLAAMRVVPRHRFVPDDYVDLAYADHPLPIGHGQTISQPYIVALMSEALEVEPGDRVLEIGTGSGYQAAVLGQMGVEVYTMEIIPELAAAATNLLGELGYADVTTRHADGYHGWEEHAPFDAIIVTAAPDHVPQPLVSQLGPGARLVIPVGPVGAVQTLWKFTADASGELVGESLGAVTFVPFTRTGTDG